MKKWMGFFAVVFIFFGFFSISCRNKNSSTKISQKHNKVEKVRKIGKVQWFTEYSIDEAFKTAKKEDKIVFIDFSTVWCHPCQMLKEKVYSSGGFSKIIQKAVPVYVEGTTKKGAELCKKYNVKAFPTVKLFDKNGKEIATIIGARLNTEFYLNLVSMASIGITKENLIEKIKQGKVSLKQAIDFSFVFDYWEWTKKFNALETAIENYKGNDTPLIARGIEELIFAVITGRQSNSKDLKKMEEKLLKHISALPENYRDLLKLEYKFLVQKGKVENSLTDKVLEENELKGLLINLRMAFPSILSSLIFEKRFEKANKVLADAIKFAEKGNMIDSERTSVIENIAYAIQLAGAGLEMNKKDEAKEAKMLGDYLWQFYNYFKDTHFNSDLSLFSYVNYFHMSCGVLTDEVVSVLNEKLKTAKDKNQIYMKIVYAYLYGGEIEKAEEIIKTKLAIEENRKKLGNKGYANMLNNICWEFVLRKHSDNYLISLSEQSVKLSSDPALIDTLANLYALKGDYEKAVELEKKAVEILKNKKSSEREIRPYLEALSKWEKQLK